MLIFLGHATVRHRRLILVLAVVGFAAAGMLGGDVASKLSTGGFNDPDSESSRAADALLDDFGAGNPNLVLLVSAADGEVDGAEVAAAGQALTAELADEPDVVDVASYWSLGAPPPLRSDDGTRALVVGRIVGDDNEVNERIEELSPAFTRQAGGQPITVAVGGFAEVFRQIGSTIEADIVRAELIALPITLVLLLFVFGSAVAAALPLLIGALSVVSTFLVLRIIASLTEVSVFSLSLTTALGLGLAIDYSLFVVSRYREELAAGHEPAVAVTRTVRTAGRTVAFSALTVAASLSALLVFPLAFLRSFAYAGVAVSALAGLCAVVVLPALLAVLGPRVEALSIRRRPSPPVGEGLWHRVAVVVMRRPLPVATAALVALIALGTPVLHLELGLPDDRVLPEGSSSREVSEVLRDDFTTSEANALSVVATDLTAGDAAPGDPATLDEFSAVLSRLDGVARVDSASGAWIDGALVLPAEATTGPAAERFAGFVAADTAWWSVVPAVEPLSAEGEALVGDLRAMDAPVDVLVGGDSAGLVDTKGSLFARIPLAAAIVTIVTFALLFLMFGSVVVPAKALVLNVLSLSATFGAMVWIFQDGNLAGALDVTATGSIAATMPVLMFCVAFGLSMDYEVFLLSRIKEEHDDGHDNVASVARGLERTGRIVTAAALLISVVFIAFATSGVSFIKLFGIGLTLAVLLDAFVIRGTLVPAFMRLAGDANWWAPGPLRRLHDRIGFSEHVELDPAETESDTVVDVRPPDQDGNGDGGQGNEREPVGSSSTP
ncbi:MMPL family transporter [soil metagenome]